MRMAMLTSTEIVCVIGLSPWIHHGLARSGWDGLASGGHVHCGGLIAFSALNSRSACLYAGATPTASRNRGIRWVGDNHVASLGISFLCCSFLCLYSIVSEDSHCHMGGSDVVNPGLH